VPAQQAVFLPPAVRHRGGHRGLRRQRPDAEAHRAVPLDQRRAGRTSTPFLASLAQEKRKKIRQERRKVAEAGVTFRALEGKAITVADWDFFYRCYERTYLEHGNAPYLTRDFFRRMAGTMPENWLLFIAERGGKRIASSLIGIADRWPMPLLGRAGAVDCLHFEACYYQPLPWCIANGFRASRAARRASTRWRARCCP
jgi:predicted N-acyltransferase